MLLNNRLYSKPFVGSLLIHVVLLSFFILSFQTTIHSRSASVTSHNQADIVQAVVVDEPPVKIQARQLEQVEQVKLARLKQDMAQAKKEIKQETNQLAAMKDENQAEQQRLKEVQQTRLQEEKKRAALKQKAAAAALAQAQAQKAQAQATKEKALKAAAAEKTRIAAEKASIAAHQKQIATEVEQVLGLWSTKIKNNRRMMIEGMPAHLSCRVALQVLPDGSVRVALVQGSGHAVYDDLSIKAIYKSEPFDLPDNPEVRDQLKNIELNFLNDEGI
jgi:membrane protein involved in colicin uptake